VKKLFPLLFLLKAQAIGPTEFSVSLPLGVTTVLPLTPVSVNLVVRGCDSISASVNGTSLGTLLPPYRISFTSLASGSVPVANTIICTNWNDRGMVATTTLYLYSTSTTRLFPRKAYR